MSQPNLPLILIIGACGHVGKETLISLRKNAGCADYRVLAGVRDLNESRESMLDTFGSDAALCDLDQPESVAKAMKGVSKVLLILPQVENRLEQCKVAVNAAKENNVQHFVFLSMAGCDTTPIHFARQFKDCEDYIKQSGLTYTFIRPMIFQETFLGFADSIVSSASVRIPIGDAKIVPVSTADVGEVASDVILGEIENYKNKIYTLSGDEKLSGEDIAAAIRRVSGKEITFTASGSKETVELLKSIGYAEWEAQGLLEVFESFSKNQLNVVTDDLKTLLGRPAKKFEESMNSHRDHFVIKGMTGVEPR